MSHSMVGASCALLLALFATSCDAGDGDSLRGPAGAGDSGESVRRLGPGDFATASAPLDRAVATIDDESRAVVSPPSTRAVFSALGLAPEDGAIRADVPADAFARLTPGGSSLRVQRNPEATPDALFEHLATSAPWKRVSTHWSVTASGGGGGVLTWTPSTPLDPKSRYSVELDAHEPGAARLASEPFDLEPGATVELAFGLTTNTNAEGFSPVRFRVDLRCRDGDVASVADETIGRAPNPGWREARLTRGERGADCVLELEATDRAGRPPPGAAFAVPRIVSPAPPREPNLVLISLDTLRADHLSGYGYPRETSPQIDARLFAEGTAFADVSTAYSRTDVSHLSILSGLYGEARPDPRRVAAGTPTPMLAERLRDAGFETVAFTEDGLVSGSFGFWWGFDRFVETKYDGETSGVSTFEDARRYVATHADRRFFLFVHTYKTHAPYASGDAYRRLFDDPADWELPGMQRVKPKGRAIADAYDRTIRDADDLVGGLLDEIDAAGVRDRTIVVLLSDHGEGLTEHGPPGHSYSRFQEVTRVPLVLRGPGIPSGLVIDAPVSLVDVTPTLLDLLGLPPLPVAQGVSLTPALRGEPLPEDRPLYFSWLGEDPLGVRRGRWKYSKSRTRRLYDLAADPHETRSVPHAAFPDGDRLLELHRAESARIRERLEAATVAPDGGPDVISEETEAALRALGYVE